MGSRRREASVWLDGRHRVSMHLHSPLDGVLGVRKMLWLPAAVLAVIHLEPWIENQLSSAQLCAIMHMSAQVLA
jgi:hypothetical protein